MEEIDALLDETKKIKITEPGRALALSKQARELSERAGDSHRLADSLLEIGACLYNLSKFEAAREALSQALMLYQKLQDIAGEAQALNEIGVCWGELGENSKSLENHLQSLALWQKIDNPRGLSHCLGSTGNRYYYLAQYDLALEYYQRSLAIREEIGDLLGIASSYNNLAIISEKFGDRDQAIAYYHKSIGIYEQIHDTIGLANTLLNLAALTNEALGQPEQARSMLEQALSQVKGSNKLLEALCLQELGNVARGTRQYDQADSSYRASLALLEEMGSDQLMAELLVDYAKSLIAQSSLDSALQSLNRALDLAASSSGNETVFQAHQLISGIYEQKGDYGSALSHYKEYHRVHEAVFNAQTELRVKGLLITGETERARHEAEIYRLKHEELSNAHRDLQNALAQNKILLHNLQLKTEDLLHQVWEDALTQIHNRRYLEMRLDEESERARRFGHDLTGVMIDVDNFKFINDQLSHPVGDQVLKIVAQILASSCRSVDSVGRYGGDEFLLLLLETGPGQAAAICERVRQAVMQYHWDEIHPDLSVTLSMGVSTIKNLPERVSLIEHADANLYEAKRGGRNCIVGLM